jgi:hypothetical protein
VARDQKRRRPGPGLLDRLQEREAVHPRHLDVGHDRVVVDLAQPLERGGRGVARVDLEAVHPQPDRLRERLEKRVVVVDDEDADLAHSSGSW